MTLDDVTAGIAATVTARGLKCTAVRDDADYPLRLKVSDERRKYLQDRLLERSGFHGEWNYALLPVPRPAPEPEPAPENPGRVSRGVLSHPALTGIPAADLDALAERFQAAFEARLDLEMRIRKGPRTRARHSADLHGNRRTDITDHLLALRLRDHLNLPHQAIAALLGVDQSVVGRAIAMTRELLDTARITLDASRPPEEVPRTPGELLAYAAEAGIPLAIPETGHTMPERFTTRRSRAEMTRPKQSNK